MKREWGNNESMRLQNKKLVQNESKRRVEEEHSGKKLNERENVK